MLFRDNAHGQNRKHHSSQQIVISHRTFLRDNSLIIMYKGNALRIVCSILNIDVNSIMSPIALTPLVKSTPKK